MHQCVCVNISDRGRALTQTALGNVFEKVLVHHIKPAQGNRNESDATYPVLQEEVPVIDLPRRECQPAILNLISIYITRERTKFLVVQDMQQ
jgi:hypothetical protein